MAMGIDQEIQRRMDAYRGNPQGLQQRYQMSQQLLDLLALQKLKSEKDAVARQMQAQMQQMPSTVAQQREQELLGRTKQEMAQQVGGVMQQQARQQQQNMARMAQAAARPQGGIAGLAPQGARMAGGGIVAFQKGGLTGREIGLASNEELMQAVREGRISLEDAQQEIRARVGRSPAERLAEFSRMVDERGEQFITYPFRKIPDLLSGAARKAGEAAAVVMGGPESYAGSNAASLPALLAAADKYLNTPTLEAVPPTPPLPAATTSAPATAPATKASESMAGVDDRELPPNLPPGPDSGTRDDGGMAGPRGPQSVISGVRDITAPAIPEKSSRTGEIESGIAALRTQGDPMGQLRGLTEFTDQYLRRGDIRKAGEERARRLAELDRAQMDPEALRRERLMASLIGAAGKSTFGLTGAGAAAGAENARQQQRIAERQRLVDQMALEQDVEKTDIELAKEGLAAGKVGYEQAALNRRAAEDIAMRLGADETKRVVQNARAELDALVANQQIDIEAAKDVAAQALQALKERGDDRRALERELGDVQRKRADFYEEAMSLALTNASLRGEVTAEEKKELEDQAILTANAWANEAGLLESEQRLEARIRELGGNVGVRRSRMISQ